MARRGVRINGNTQAPPPSTLAAQIVQNQTRPAASQQQQGEQTFHDLLHEILHSPEAVQETDVNVNARLISVVTEVGLLPLTTGDPFANGDAAFNDAASSIVVIEKTITRQPNVLFVQLTPDGPHVFLNLLTTLLALIGRPKCGDLKLCQLLSTIIACLNSSIDLWKNARTVTEVLQECVDDILSAFEALPSPSENITIKLPPARSVGKLWPGLENSITMPQGNTTTITETARAFMLALHFLQLPGLSMMWAREARYRLQTLALKVKPSLEKAEQWIACLKVILQFSESCPLMSQILADCAKSPPSMAVQVQVSKALIHILRDHANVAKDLLLPPMEMLGECDVWADLNEDLRIAVVTWLCRFQPQDELPEKVKAMRDALRQDNVMTDAELQHAFQQLSVAHVCTKRRPRRCKRRRLSEIRETTARHHSNFERTTGLLTGVRNSDILALADVAPSVYVTLDEDDKCAAWQSLAELSEMQLPITAKTITRLINLEDLRNARKARVLSMLAVRACVRRSTDPDHTSLGSSEFGNYCLKSLCSSLRELRLAAAQSLPAFLRDDLPEDVWSHNRRLALESLRTWSDRDVASEQETLIAAWGQVAIACGEEELNLVLLRLVEYLGHRNTLICALAFTEIESIAAARRQSIQSMFQPFWRSIAVSVVQDLTAKPHKAQQLSDLLSIDLNNFLALTQKETLPLLVLTKRTDILQRIANARGMNSIRDLCTQPLTNLAAIITLLLNKSSGNIADSAFACFTAVDPGFKVLDLAGLIRLDAVLVACEMLKHCGEEPESRKSRAYQAFQTMANIEQSLPGQQRAHSKASRALTSFFDKYLLGILAHFSGRLEESGPGVESLPEKVRCIKALAELFTLTKGNVSVALPQIRAGLQSALQQPELCEFAFNAWLTLLPLLQEDDVANIVDETFVLIVRHWSAFSPDLQQKTHETISQLVKAHNTLLQENLMTLPSLQGIPLLSKFAGEFDRLKNMETPESHCKAFVKRLRVGGDAVVFQTLVELVPFLEANQDFVHENAASEQPPPVLSDLLCALLDATVKYSSSDEKAAELCGKALGIIGCLDPNRVEANRRNRQILVLSNFDKETETVDWVMALLEDVLVKAFKSATNARAQGFLAYTMQELLKACGLGDLSAGRTRASQGPYSHERWELLSEATRTTLTPFLASRYVITSAATALTANRLYPSFSADASHGHWLRSITCDLMFKAKGDNAKEIFPLLARTIRGHDLAIARFIFPFAVLNVVLGGTVSEVQGIADEFLAVLRARPASSTQQECIRLCSEMIFNVLDHLSTWLTEKRKEMAEARNLAYKTGQSSNEMEEARDIGQVDTIANFLASIPAEVIANQAIECRSYARALFHWEQYIRQERSIVPSKRLSEKDEIMYDRLQDIYSQIDEPDGLEGIAAHLPVINEAQQAFNHAKAGRWTAAQAWYELQLGGHPTETELQHRVLKCLRETGQHAPLLKYANTFLTSDGDVNVKTVQAHLPLATEACWMSEDIDSLHRMLSLQPPEKKPQFNVSVGRALMHAAEAAQEPLMEDIHDLRKSIAESLSMAGTDSLQNCHDELLKLHVIYELEAVMTADVTKVPLLLQAFDKRLTAVGSYVQDKQYILGIRRAAMRLRPDEFSDTQTGAMWLTTARLARQAGNTSSAYNAVLKAAECGDRGAKLEQARLLWHEGHQRQAMQSLEAAIESGVFTEEDMDPDVSMANASISMPSAEINGYKQDMLSAKALLLLAKWLDASGQSQTKDMTDRYQLAARRYQRWEKGHYYLGKHYGKLLDAQKQLPRAKQSQPFLTGELAKLVIDNQLRSIPFGTKYWHETIPRVLTLWLEMGTEAMNRGKDDQTTYDKRMKTMTNTNRQISKYFERVPCYVFYHALPQLISRIAHPHPEVWKQLSNILTKIASTHPSQTLWSLFAVIKAKEQNRSDRGLEILAKLKDPKNKPKVSDSSADLRTMIAQGQRLCEGLLQASERPVDARAVQISLGKDLAFNHKLAPSQLVVPIETTLTASAPPASAVESIRRHKAFTQDKITIAAFTDDVLVLNSLQRPRKITIRGSDGKLYGLLCKPKDDLRKDQRLMEFNGIINRALKRDTESSKRRLYIKTYAVTPLSEESGCIEWVEGIKPTRDILLNLYNRKGVRPNYTEIRKDLDLASSSPDNAHVFGERVLNQFPPVLHEWFTETYPEPDIWFAARLRYSRSAAVMSMVGHILGLGDRHGENILLEESTGGVFHVDFNCLFDKGLTFEKPEMVPFRLTHNMQDAMGPYSHEGPFRKSSELTLNLLRQEKDTLMTVLETFLYDPTTDFVGKKKRSTAGVPETPAEILESVAQKLKGLLRNETVPLSVEGYVDALVQEATSHFRLASMYIGWCSFL